MQTKQVSGETAIRNSFPCFATRSSNVCVAISSAESAERDAAVAADVFSFPLRKAPACGGQ